MEFFSVFPQVPSKVARVSFRSCLKIFFGVSPEIYLRVFPTGETFLQETLPGCLSDFIPVFLPKFIPGFLMQAFVRSSSRDFCTSSIWDSTDVLRHCFVSAVFSLSFYVVPLNIFLLRFLQQISLSRVPSGAVLRALLIEVFSRYFSEVVSRFAWSSSQDFFRSSTQGFVRSSFHNFSRSFY